jgi:RNA polymerase sigma-70 factor (ECF subfamily)
VLRKDRKATAEFVERHADVLYSYLMNRLSPRADLVDDVLQEVYMAAWESLARFEGRSSLKHWMLGIARHKVETHYRGLLREPLPLDDEGGATVEEPSVPPDVEEWMEQQRRNERAREILDSLPESYAVVLRWRYWERRSAAEMAEATGKTPKAIERLLARAREQFRRRWDHE